MDTFEFENKRWSEKPQKMQFRHTAALEMVEQGSVLDVGCGDGLLLRLLVQKGLTAQGVDISSVAIEQCRAVNLTATRVDFSSGQLPFANTSLTHVIALDVLEHLYDPQSLLAEMARVAKESVIIGVPNFSSLPARLHVLRGVVPENNTPHKGHIYWFNWLVLIRMAAACGLVVDACKVNVMWEKIPLIGSVMRFLARLRPNLFALSFVVRFVPRKK